MPSKHQLWRVNLVFVWNVQNLSTWQFEVQRLFKLIFSGCLNQTALLFNIPYAKFTVITFAEESSGAGCVMPCEIIIHFSSRYSVQLQVVAAFHTDQMSIKYGSTVAVLLSNVNCDPSLFPFRSQNALNWVGKWKVGSLKRFKHHFKNVTLLFLVFGLSWTLSENQLQFTFKLWLLILVIDTLSEYCLNGIHIGDNTTFHGVSQWKLIYSSDCFFSTEFLCAFLIISVSLVPEKGLATQLLKASDVVDALNMVWVKCLSLYNLTSKIDNV